MFRNLPLLDVLDREASPEERQAYEPLRRYMEPPLCFVLGGPPDAYELAHRRCWTLQKQIWSRVAERLEMGQWSARGFTPPKIEPVQIPAALWPHLEVRFHSQEAFSRVEDAYVFKHVRISDALPQRNVSQRGVASTRAQLTRWIEAHLAAQHGPQRKADVLAASRLAFDDTGITDNLFNEAWRAARKPGSSLQVGRPRG